MIGGGCTFLKLAQKVDDIKATLQNDEQRVSNHLCAPHVCTAIHSLHQSCRVAPLDKAMSCQHTCLAGAAQT